MLIVLVACIAALLSGAPSASAAVANLLPNAVATDSASFAVSGCSTPRSTCIDETVPGSVNDADALNVSAAGPVSITFDLTTMASAYVVDTVELNFRARCITASATGNIDVGIYNASNVQIGTTLSQSITSTWTNYTRIITGVSIPQTTLDGMRLRFTTGACSSGSVSISAASLRVFHPVVATEVTYPNGDRLGGVLYKEGCATYSYSCIDERMAPFSPADPSPDADAVSFGPAPGCWGGGGSPTELYEMSDLPVNAGQIISTQFHIRARQSTPFNASDTNIRLYNSVGVALTGVSGIYVDNTGVVDKHSAVIPLSSTKAILDAAYAEVSIIHTSCSRNYLFAFNNIVTYLEQQEISGRALTTAGGAVWSECDGVTTNVRIVANGVGQNVACNASTGAYSTYLAAPVGSIVTAFLNDATPANNGGVAYTMSPSNYAEILSFDVVKNEVRVRSETDAYPLQPVNLVGIDSTLDADIPVTFTSTTVVAPSSTTIVATSGYWAPVSATVTAGKMRIDAGAKWYSQYTNMITLTGSGTGACASATARPYCQMDAVGLMSYISLTYTGTSTLDVDGAPMLYALHLRPASGSPTYRLGSSSDATLDLMNVLEIGTGAAAVTVSTATHAPTITTGSHVTVAALATLSGAGTGTFTIGGDLTGDGAINLTGGIVDLRYPLDTTLNASGTLPGTAWQFATLRVSNSAGSPRNVTIPATSREVRASVALQIGQTLDAATTTLQAAAMTRPITVTGDLDLTSRGILTAPPLFELQGNLASAGVWNAGTGELVISGTGTTAYTSTGSGAIYDLTITTPSKTLTLAAPFKVTNQLTLAGGSCATPVTMRSANAGVQRIIDTSGATVSVSLTSFRDVVFSTPITTISAGDLGNNSGITFNDANCTAPTLPYVDTTDASAGSTKPTDIDGTSPFHLSFRNSAGTAVDRFRTRVTTTPIDATVKALFPLQSNGNDLAAGNTATGTAPAYVARAGNYGMAGNFDGVNDVLAAPTTTEYDASVFTIEAWMRAPAASANATPTIVSRGTSATDAQFRIWMDTATGMLRGGVTSGGVMYSAATSATPWLDDAWHHVALTVDGSNNIRLYLDGSQYGSTVAHPGTIDTPAAPLRIGGGWGAGTYFDGMVDDVRFSDTVHSAATMRGYIATGRPHGAVMWSSSGFGTTSGAALPASCGNSVRCGDIVYGGGTAIHQAGARYYATHQARTTAGLWSAGVTDWFETADQITVSAPASVAIPAIAPFLDSTATLSVTTTCGHASGCDLLLSAPSDTIALSHTSTSASIGTFTTGTPVVWAAGTPGGLGFTVLSSTSGKDTTQWGTGANFSSLPALKFAGLERAPLVAHSTIAAGSETTVLGMRLNVGGPQATGSYTGVANVTSVPNV